MLQLKFNISVEQDSSSIIFEDVTGNYSSTNPGGYGTPNIPRSNILQTKLNVVFPGGGSYLLFSNYLPSMGKWRIPAGLFSDLNKKNAGCYTPVQNCGCQVNQSFISVHPLIDDCHYVNIDCERPNTLTKFMDGCYEFRYEVYASSGVGQILCDYLVQTVICEGQTLEVKQNGGWVDVTEDATNQHGNLIYQLTQSPLDITSWRVMSGSNVVKNGPVSGTNCAMSESVANYEEPQLAQATTKIFPFYSEVTSKLSNKSAMIITEDCEIQSSITGQPIDIFSLAHARLNLIKGNPQCGCDRIKDNLEGINLLLDSIKQR